MKKFFCILAMAIVACAFTLPVNDPFATNILRNFLLRAKVQPQEKIYLHTDRDHYQAEDKIWFRAYMLDAVTHKPSENSRYVYVELVDRLDSVRQRVKISGTDSVYSGYIPLPKKIEQGEYFLRAYTYWMQNQGENFIFKKKIRIVNINDSKVVTNITYAQGKDGEVVEIHLKNSRDVVYGKAFVEYKINGNLKTQRADDQGVIRINSKDIGKNRNLLLSFKDADPLEFERSIYIPERSTDFDLQFFPEGGNLMAGNMQTVAFKAVGTDGLGKDVEGVLYNEKDEFVAAIKSMHKGMGGIDFTPENGRRYHAVVTSSDSVKKRIELPLPKNDALALKVWMRDSVLNYAVLLGDSTNVQEDLYLMVLSRGVPLLCAPLTRTVGRLPMNVLPEGVVQLVLMNSKYDIYSQRLCFVRKKERPELSVEMNKQTYIARDLASMTAKVDREDGQLEGSFSVAVTDDVQSDQDSLVEDNILSNILLTSDLKGYIEEPAFYFRNVNRSTERMLDMLMLTQGWTRFDLPKVMRGELSEPPYYLEKGQAISGTVKNFWGKDAGKAQLLIFSTTGVIQSALADSSGHFVIDGIAFPDGTQFVVQAQNKKGGKSVEVKVDKDQFLKPAVNYPYNTQSVNENNRFYEKYAKDFFYDNGMKVYVLDEVMIKRRKESKAYSMYDHMATYGLDSAKLASMDVLDIRQVFEEIPGVRVDEGNRVVVKLSKSLAFYVNDIKEDYDYVMTMNPKDLLNISLIDGAQAGVVIGPDAANGALVITTNPNFVRNSKVKLDMAVMSFLGYQKKAEFYVPKYDVDSVRQALAKITDSRPTIYWNPDVRTDASGKAEFSFFTSDSYGPYTLIMEGVLNDGTVCRKVRRIDLKLPR